MFKYLSKKIKQKITLSLIFLILIISLALFSLIYFDVKPIIIIFLSAAVILAIFLLTIKSFLYSFKELNNWYEQILDFVYLPMSITDKDMNWTFINKPVKDIIGLKRDQAISRHCSNWDADICNTERCGIYLLRNGEQTSYFTNEGIDKFFQVDTTYLYDLKKNKIGHLELVSDITAKVKFDEVIDEFKKLGMMSESKSDFQDLDDQNAVHKNIYKMRQYTLGTDAKRAMELYKATKEEIAKHKEAKLALYEIQSQQKELLNHTSNVVYMKDIKGRYTFINKMYEHLFDITEQDILGKTDLDFMPQNIANEVMTNDRLILESGKLIEFEEVIELSDGYHTYISVKFPLRNVNDEIYSICGISTDITERKKQELELIHHKDNLEQIVKERTIELEESLEELVQTQKKLIESEKMSSISELVVGLSHEMNTPIGIVLTAASHLYGLTKDNDDINKLSNLILTNIQKVSKIISKFKEISVHLANEKVLEFSMCKFIHEITNSLQFEFKNTGHFVNVICDEDFRIKSYPLALNKVVTYLLLNSIIHGFEEKKGGIIEIKISKKDNIALLEISDNGKGIPEDKLSKIFDPFYTTKRGAGLSGLGLNIVYNLVNHILLGEIDCTSITGKGTYFKIQIPSYINVK